ncbi:MAG: hypothetical protein RL291_1684 [Pseudomonadota bacterium]
MAAIATALQQAIDGATDTSKVLAIGPSLVIPVILPILSEHCITPR